jgi:hypothetical protein
MNTANDSTQEFAKRIMEAGGVLTVWGVLREDAYETPLGDGYYAYLHAVTLDEAEAHRLAETLDEHMVNWHLRRYDLSLANGMPVLITESRQFEPVELATIAAALVDGELAK